MTRWDWLRGRIGQIFDGSVALGVGFGVGICLLAGADALLTLRSDHCQRDVRRYWCAPCGASNLERAKRPWRQELPKQSSGWNPEQGLYTAQANGELTVINLRQNQNWCEHCWQDKAHWYCAEDAQPKEE